MTPSGTAAFRGIAFAPVAYSLTYDANGGTGSQSDADSPYAAGALVTVKDQGTMSRDGYTFSGWSTAPSGGTAYAVGATFNISANTTLYAQWTPTATGYTITATAGDHGSISPSGTVSVNSGGSQSFNFTPETGYHVADVVVDDLSQGPSASYDFSGVAANHTIHVSFAINTYTLTYSAGAHGSISGLSPQTVYYNASGTTVTAVPDTGYHFVSWSDGVQTVSRTDTGVQANLSVTANFAINTYTLTYAAGANGSISGTTPQTVDYNASGTTVTAVPDTGYHFVSWSDGVQTASRTESGVQANLSVSANFAINTYTLTYAAGANGSISGLSPQTVDYNASGTTVTAVPDTGYHFVSWSDGVQTVSRTDTGVQANLSVTANFAINTYTLTYAAGANGTISGTTPQTVDYNASGTTVTAVPDAGHHFVSWSDGVQTASRTESGVQANLSVTANFAINTYTLTYSAGANGTISGTSPQTVDYNASGTTVTAVPDTGYQFVSWSDGVLTAARTDLNVQSDITVTATFSLACSAPEIVGGVDASSTGICVGNPFVFALTNVTGTSPSYQWRLNQNDLPGANTASYTRLAATLEDLGDYDCVVSNACGAITSSVVTLAVYPVPGAPATTGASRCESGSVELTASGSGGTIKWYSDPELATLVAVGGSYSPAVSATTSYYVTETSASGCTSPTSTVIAAVHLPATASAGPNQMVSADTLTVSLVGTVGGAAAGGTWTGGAGSFDPGPTALNVSYTPTAQEKAARQLTLTLNTTGPNQCAPASSSTVIVFNSAPQGSNLLTSATQYFPVTLQVIGGPFAVSDPDGDTMLVSAVEGNLPHGYATTDGTSITYTATNSAPVTNTFYYVLTDSFGASCTNTVTVSVEPPGQGFNRVAGPIDNHDGTMTITFMGRPGWDYALEATPSLVAPVDWTALKTNTVDAGGNLSFTFEAGAGGQGFFRTRYVPAP